MCVLGTTLARKKPKLMYEYFKHLSGDVFMRAVGKKKLAKLGFGQFFCLF